MSVCVWEGGGGGVFVPPSSLMFKIALGVMTALIANPKERRQAHAYRSLGSPPHSQRASYF